ncbi:mannitol-1-phosphate 5-dehydrogenase [Gregarina niphandrodes]|uniref:Mannitol-1-phosphate 5-dehydrogenase n=1 Tax=Gregarina niphandrodes TaxID=110365 RepID=A0A023B8B3_GRENI|nr:mannitol-1-phosphate 5-dehydrogenase [Gregarina niphandrodes]EZG68900.1 mannitol-1-phosphate 5-dehydrogenase [Gregarina niphandrodes]|eukprot:XP_011134524.1 mannitol-1-phosphate 5-dehydrogenase [Gregarina niphandrodes]
MRALHFGAGNIGRGFIGKLLAEAGYDVVFADIVPDLINALKERKQFEVRIVGQTGEKRETTKISGAVFSNTDEVLDEIVKADLITTAVGPRILERIASTFAKGLAMRREQGVKTPVTIIACENAIRATSGFRVHIETAFDPTTAEWAKEKVGFVDCAVDRIVPPARHDDMLAVTVEDFCEWVVDETQFPAGGKIEINHPAVVYTDNLDAFVERKLMTVNTGHAICAYIGKLKGYKEIRTSIEDPEVFKIVKGAMTESGNVLVKRYGLNAVDHAKYIDKILNRFKNPHIVDDVSRVGREPMRKLSAQDRLIKPLAGCIEYGLPHENLTMGVAAALMYDNPEDPQAVTLQTMVKEKGREAVLTEVCGLDAQDHSSVVSNVHHAYQKLTDTISSV